MSTAAPPSSPTPAEPRPRRGVHRRGARLRTIAYVAYLVFAVGVVALALVQSHGHRASFAEDRRARANDYARMFAQGAEAALAAGELDALRAALDGMNEEDSGTRVLVLAPTGRVLVGSAADEDELRTARALATEAFRDRRLVTSAPRDDRSAVAVPISHPV